jgi:dimethylamine/trimethylamine dehydrogenase
VTIAEKSDEMGGRVSRESRLKGLTAWNRVRDYRLYQLQQLPDVELFLESEITLETAAEFGADHVFAATGSRWRGDGLGRSCYSPIPGFDGHSLTPDDIMNGLEIEGPVVIYDDDHYYMANILAEHLAERGHEVHLVSPQPVIAGWMAYTLEQPRVLASLAQAGVGMYPNTTATEWRGGHLLIERTDNHEELAPIRAGALLSVTARLPSDELAKELIEAGLAVTAIGDAVAPGIIQAAVFSGHRAAREFLGTEPANRVFKREVPSLIV